MAERGALGLTSGFQSAPWAFCVPGCLTGGRAVPLLAAAGVDGTSEDLCETSGTEETETKKRKREGKVLPMIKIRTEASSQMRQQTPQKVLLKIIWSKQTRSVCFETRLSRVVH